MKNVFITRTGGKIAVSAAVMCNLLGCVTSSNEETGKQENQSIKAPLTASPQIASDSDSNWFCLLLGGSVSICGSFCAWENRL